MRLVRGSLRDKLVVVFLVPTLLIVLGYGVLAYAAARQELEAELGRRITAIGQTLSAEMSGGFDAAQLERLDASKKRTRKRLAARLERTRSVTGSRRIFIFNRKLRSLVDTDARVAFDAHLYTLDQDRYEIERAFTHGESTTSVLFSAEDGTRYKTAYVPIFRDAERKEVVAVVGVAASASFFALLTNFAAALALIGLVGLALVVVVSLVFARQLTRPVEALVTAAERLGQGDLHTPIEPVGAAVVPGHEAPGDELAFLSRAFDEMRVNILSRDQQLQMMLSGIAHEVRNPLGGMELFCGLLREDLELEAQWLDGDAAAGAADKIDKVDRIQKELSYLDKVVTDFLDFARNRAVEQERFDAWEFSFEIAGLLGAQAEEAGCTLTTEVEEGMALTADRERLRRVVINLIRNACQALQAAGQPGAVTLRVLAPDDTTRVIEVQDDGPGIPPERLTDIMTPFFTTKEKGSGLGLPLSAKIIEQHGGSMQIDSTPGQGTTIRLTWPFDDTLAAHTMEIPEGWLG